MERKEAKKEGWIEKRKARNLKGMTENERK